MEKFKPIKIVKSDYSRKCGTPYFYKLDEDCKTRDKLYGAIKSAEGRATARTITPDDVISAIKMVEEKIDINFKDMEGVKFTADMNAQNFPRAYKYTADSTYIDCEFSGGVWRITDIYRYPTETPNNAIKITLTETAKAAVLKSHSVVCI